MRINIISLQDASEEEIDELIYTVENSAKSDEDVLWVTGSRAKVIVLDTDGGIDESSSQSDLQVGKPLKLKQSFVTPLDGCCGVSDNCCSPCDSPQCDEPKDCCGCECNIEPVVGRNNGEQIPGHAHYEGCCVGPREKVEVVLNGTLDTETIREKLGQNVSEEVKQAIADIRPV